MAGKQARIRSSKPKLTTPSDAVADAVLSAPGKQEVERSRSQEVEKSNSLEVKKLSAQIDVTVWEELHRFYLQLQMDLGQANAPFKEVIVEEAIAHLLTYASENREAVLQSLMERQSTRG